jgi:hypothetical protein
MTRLACESVRSLDVRRALRQGRLKVGAEFVASLTRGPESDGVVYIIVERDALVLVERGFQRVALSRTPCNFGGERAWAICPRCSRRVAVLFDRGSQFACRTCGGLTYLSRQQTPQLRAIQRARKMRERFGGGENLMAPFPDKPKKMHWRTYDRLVRRYADAVARATSHIHR